MSLTEYQKRVQDAALQPNAANARSVIEFSASSTVSRFMYICGELVALALCIHTYIHTHGYMHASIAPSAHPSIHNTCLNAYTFQIGACLHPSIHTLHIFNTLHTVHSLHCMMCQHMYALHVLTNMRNISSIRS